MKRTELPEVGMAPKEVVHAMGAIQADDAPWYGPRRFIGGSYYGGEEVQRVADRASQDYQHYNALYAGKVFPSLVRYEREVVDILLSLLHAPQTASGCVTSGGTESLLLAVKTARDWATAERSGTTSPAKIPEIVVSHAAHPGFDKAAHLLGMRSVRVAEGREYRADVGAMAQAITSNTVMLAASAPSYPYGVTDPVEELAELARTHQLWLHVDACHGGFVLPFARKLGQAIPAFDFEVPGVTSISVDVHKLGYANKGVSVLLLRDEALSEFQQYRFTNWPAGAYRTAAVSGSRSAGGLASAWAVMQFLGEAGYCEIVKNIIATREKLVAGVGRIADLQVRGKPDAYLVAFGSAGYDSHAVADGMEDRDWVFNRLRVPPSLHLFLDRSHNESIDLFLADLQQVMDDVRSGRRQARPVDTVYAV
ncbi:MAG: aminotransferase class V-fold PLP-dependent enzyme [Planctomycetota bacterium]|nr:aminotransferase class V-fold PLP-dependent enzyme [Planctomycetota bacterium]